MDPGPDHEFTAQEVECLAGVGEAEFERYYEELKKAEGVPNIHWGGVGESSPYGKALMFLTGCRAAIHRNTHSVIFRTNGYNDNYFELPLFYLEKHPGEFNEDDPKVRTKVTDMFWDNDDVYLETLRQYIDEVYIGD